MAQCHRYLKLLISELIFSQNWISSHVSDHSAIHHRTQIVQLLLAECQPNTTPAIQASSSVISDYLSQLPIHTSDNDKDSSILRNVTRGDAQCLFQHLFHISKTLIYLRVGYEALWYDRRNMLKLFLRSLYIPSKNPSSIDIDSSNDAGNGGGSKLFRWSNVASAIHINSSIESIDVSTSTVVHADDGGSGYCCDDQVYFEISQLLCDEAAFISQLSSQEGNLAHAEESRQQLYSLRCFAHLLMVILDDIDTSITVDMTEDGGSKNFGQKGQVVRWLQRECRLALKDIAAYLVTLDPVNRYMYAYFQSAHY